MKVLLTFTLGLWSSLVIGQVTISGLVKNTEGTPVIGANVYLENTFRGDQSADEGFFAITDVEPGTYQMIISYIGYESQKEEVVIIDEELFIEITLKKSAYLADEVTVEATRANSKTPTSFSTVTKADFEANNLGQDVPYLLQFTPSAVATSDAGTGIGYTGIRIRGSDATRINVTINGIPLNDAESHNVFWVDLPDFASSVDNMQVQRGLGTSTNGAGAFGATINLLTSQLHKKPYATVNVSGGDFNTLKTTATMGSGLLANKFTIDGRFSRIVSDGYIERASSDLLSYYVSAAYFGKNNSLRLNAFHGEEVTYQSWYGLDTSIYDLEDDRTFNVAGTAKDPAYENQVDDYKQTHYQLLYAHELDKMTLNAALHYTKGAGFFEEYLAAENPTDYNLIAGGFVGDSAFTDIARRRWLDNDFYGATYSLTYNSLDRKLQVIAGGAWNAYVGEHFGETIFAASAIDSVALKNARPRYYEGTGDKQDFNFYVKGNYQLNPQFNFFGDLQYRRVSHDIAGTDNAQRDVTQKVSYNFFNPKVGVTYFNNPNSIFYFSYAMGNREPNRSDLTDAPANQRPKSEVLHDFELGYRFRLKKAIFNSNFYYMLYHNQLVLTGQINDAGAALRRNVADSYRFGLELDGSIKISNLFSWRLNVALSENKARNFVEFVDDWDNGGQVQVGHGTTTLAFSPSIIVGSEIVLDALANEPTVGTHNSLEIALQTKYVGKQFLDNTGRSAAELPAYFVNDLRISYGFRQRFLKELRFTIAIRNLFNEVYESNAWIYRYTAGGQFHQLVGLYPQAGRHFLVGLDLRF